MTAILSERSVTADIDDAARADIEGFDAAAALSTKAELRARAEKAFAIWWEQTGQFSGLPIDDAAIEAYLAGYVAMSLELGYEPQGGVA